MKAIAKRLVIFIFIPSLSRAGLLTGTVSYFSEHFLPQHVSQ